MKLTPEQLDNLVKLIRSTRQKELNCNQCLNQVATLAEHDVSGMPIPDELESTEHHLSICPECREEYDALRTAIKHLGNHATG